MQITVESNGWCIQESSEGTRWVVQGVNDLAKIPSALREQLRHHLGVSLSASYLQTLAALADRYPLEQPARSIPAVHVVVEDNGWRICPTGNSAVSWHVRNVNDLASVPSEAVESLKSLLGIPSYYSSPLSIISALHQQYMLDRPAPAAPEPEQRQLTVELRDQRGNLLANISMLVQEGLYANQQIETYFVDSSGRMLTLRGSYGPLRTN